LPQEWSEYVRQPHWTAIAGRADVLAVEPPAGLLDLIQHPARLLNYLFRGRKPRLSTSGVKLWRPVSLASNGLAFRIPLLAHLDRRWIRHQLRPVVKSITDPHQAVVSFVVKIQQYYLRDTVDADMRCYEVTDEYRVSTSDTQLDSSDPWTARMSEREKCILAEAELVIVASEPLLQSRSRQNPNTHHLSNCVEYERFSQKVPDWRSIACDLAELPEPRLGYIGGFNDLMDIDLLIRLAETYRESSVVIVGEERGSRQFRKADNYRQLKSMSNVFFLGHKPYETLPAYLHGLDVCLMPFLCNEWIRNSSPNKTYQYLAAGKPVVSTDFPEARRVESAVLVAEDHDQFISMVSSALDSNSAEKIRARQEKAKANTCDTRAEAVLELVRQSLQTGRVPAEDT
jgi:glycosyltransferase involved in cell wall biosynthesis